MRAGGDHLPSSSIFWKSARSSSNLSGGVLKAITCEETGGEG